MKPTEMYEGLHVAIIMDGNGRWATARGLPRIAGHRAGASSVRQVVEAAPGLGIRTLTLFAFSSDNWKRPQGEVSALMELFEKHLKQETRRCVKNGVRVKVIGRRDRLSPALIHAIQKTEIATAQGRRLNLRLAVDYSGRQAILQAAVRLQDRPISMENFASLLRAEPEGKATSDVDLLIRTGGEQRLSDFLLWECAYAELLFRPEMWPDFNPATFEAAMGEFHHRERRFGALPAATLVG